LLQGLARLVEELHPGVRIAVVEGGGVMNHASVGSGRLPMAILNPPMTVAALAGREPFTRAFPDLRVAVANLTVNHLQLMVDARIDLRSLDEWPARRLPLRIPVDRVGTVDRLVFDLALAHVGLDPDALAAWGGRLVPAGNYDEQLRLYRDGAVDALWQFMGVPSPSIQEAHRLRPLRAVALPAALIARLTGLGWSAATLPEGAYGAVSGPAPTVAMAAAASFDPARAAKDPGGPLHAGATRYFRERGILAGGHGGDAP
jgi:TRAP-type uncharacterized transport system substrate-binding protein